MNDQQATEWIHRSLQGELNSQELTELQNYAANSPQIQQYWQLSLQIQHVLATAAADSEPGPGLNQMAHSRIAKRLAAEMAARQQEPGSQARRVAEENSDYQAGENRPDCEN